MARHQAATVTPFYAVNAGSRSRAVEDALESLDHALGTVRTSLRAAIRAVAEQAPTSSAHAELISYAEAARRLGTSTASLRRMVARGDLASVRVSERVVRVRSDEVAELIERRREVAR